MHDAVRFSGKGARRVDPGEPWGRDVRFDKVKVRRTFEFHEIRAIAGDEVVEADDGVTGIDETFREMRGEKAGCAGDVDDHEVRFCSGAREP